MKTTALLAALVVSPALANAQSVEQALPPGAAAAQTASKAIAEQRALAAAKADAARVFPSRIECSPAKDSGLSAPLVFVTRLDAGLTPAALTKKAFTVASQFAAASGETAAALDDYKAISIDKENLEYDLWSCDTQDYFFAFAVQDLARDDLNEPRRPLKAKVQVQTRGHVDYDGELDCVATF